MVGLKKLWCIKKWCWVGLYSKVVRAVGFSGKPIFLERVSFHHEMFDVTNFRLVLGVCIVNVVIFIKRKNVNLFRIGFCELLKIPIMIILKML